MEFKIIGDSKWIDAEIRWCMNTFLVCDGFFFFGNMIKDWFIVNQDDKWNKLIKKKKKKMINDISGDEIFSPNLSPWNMFYVHHTNENNKPVDFGILWY